MFLNSDLFDRLAKHGAKVTEEPFKYLHMKAVEIDEGREMTIGSFNQDHWSFYCNNEANVYLKHSRERQKVHQQFAKIFSNLQKESRPVDFDETYTPAGHIEINGWKLVLKIAYWLANNRAK